MRNLLYSFIFLFTLFYSNSTFAQHWDQPNASCTVIPSFGPTAWDQWPAVFKMSVTVTDFDTSAISPFDEFMFTFDARFSYLNSLDTGAMDILGYTIVNLTDSSGIKVSFDIHATAGSVWIYNQDNGWYQDWGNGEPFEFWIMVFHILPEGNFDSVVNIFGSNSVLVDPMITGLIESDPQNFKIYPNPATNLVTIQDSREATATITNMLGQMVRIIPTNEQVNIADLQTGVYYINRKQKLLIE